MRLKTMGAKGRYIIVLTRLYFIFKYFNVCNVCGSRFEFYYLLDILIYIIYKNFTHEYERKVNL